MSTGISCTSHWPLRIHNAVHAFNCRYKLWNYSLSGIVLFLVNFCGQAFVEHFIVRVLHCSAAFLIMYLNWIISISTNITSLLQSSVEFVPFLIGPTVFAPSLTIFGTAKDTEIIFLSSYKLNYLTNSI